MKAQNKLLKQSLLCQIPVSFELKKKKRKVKKIKRMKAIRKIAGS